MFARDLNRMRIDLSITPRGPFAIRSGREGADPTRPQLECVRTTYGGGSSVYIPGSSLKGVMRAHAERLLTTEGLAITPTFSEEARSAFNQNTPGPKAYADTCPLGRTFGSLHVKGHLGVSDHLPGAHEPEGSDARRHEIERANAVEERNSVAIDRLTGAAAGGALFDREMVVAGRFDGSILLRNAQLYQLALVLLVLRDLDEGWVQLGSGTTRGDGRVAATVREIVVETRADLGGADAEGELPGAGSLAPDPDSYRLFTADRVSLPAGLPSEKRLIWRRVRVPSTALDPFAEALIAGPWTAFLRAAQGMQWAA